MKNHLGILYSLLASITWGLSYTLDEKILTKTSPFILVFVNALVTIVVTLPIVLFRKQELSQFVKSDIPSFTLILVASLLLTLGSLLIASGIKASNASLASIIEVSYPLFVILFSILIYKSLPTPGLLAGGALIIMGTIIVAKFA